MGKKSRKATEPINSSKSQEQRASEIDCIANKLKVLGIYELIPEEVSKKIEDHILNGTNYYLKHPWPEMKREIELILNNKPTIQNRINLLYKEF